MTIKKYKSKVIQAQVEALHSFFRSQPFYAGDVGVYLEIIDSAIAELFEYRKNNNVDDKKLARFNCND